MPRKLLNVLKYLLLLAIAAGLLYFAFKGISLKNIFKEISRANLFWAFLSLLLSVVALVSRAIRWNLLIEPLGHKPKTKNSVYAVSIGYLANLAFPRLGEVSRCGVLNRAESIPFSGLLGTVIVERIIDVITLLICLLITVVIEFDRLGTFLSEKIINPVAEKLKAVTTSPVGLILLAGLAVAVIALVIYFSRRKTDDEKKFVIARFIKELINGLKTIVRLKKPWLFVFHSFFIWFLYFLSIYVCFFSLPATSHLGFSAALFALVAAGIAMSAPVQGGIGAYHLLVSQGLMLYGVAKQDGLALATLVHGFQMIMVIVVGAISLFLVFASRNSLKKQNAREVAGSLQE